MRMLLRPLLSLLLAFAASTCAARGASPSGPASRPPAAATLDACAERYVKLVLAVGQHDGTYVDAYYGPPAWSTEAKARELPLAEVAAQAAALGQQLAAMPAPAGELEALRQRFLARQTAALAMQVRLLRGERPGFDAESEGLYNARAPVHSDEHFLGLQSELDRLLPGPGPLAQRMEAFRRQFIIPADKLDLVFRTALDEARRRTLAHIPLPAGERVELEFVTNKTWGGYNWYKGDATSLIQINTDLPIFIGRAIDLAAHEGYPGHHVYNILLESELLQKRGWVEFSVYPLYSPQSLIAEGSANYDIEVAFPDEAKYLREVLFPLAGLDPQRAELYVQVEELASKLAYANNEAARGYLGGRFTREQARDWLVRHALISSERAALLLANIEVTRTYVINYNLGRDMVTDFIERQGGTDADPGRRWQLFRALLSSPRLPGDLR